MASLVRVGLQIAEFDYPGVPPEELFERLSAIANCAEESGFDSIWLMDHVHQITRSPAHPIVEPYVTLAALAARTHSLWLGALVTPITFRNPALLAKMVTTLDVVSSGRAILGIGAGWNESEARAYGQRWPDARERLDRLDESVRICRAMFTQDSATYQGRYYRIDGAINAPRPVREGGPPILIGGSGERRTLRLVAEHADICNLFAADLTDLRHKLEVLDRHCETVGRDPDQITRTHLRTVVIAPTAREAAEKGHRLRETWQLDDDRYAARVIEGDPMRVAERVDEILTAGCDGLIVNLPDTHDLETVALAGETLARF